jgi:hypothetical protein
MMLNAALGAMQQAFADALRRQNESKTAEQAAPSSDTRPEPLESDPCPSATSPTSSIPTT